MYNNNHEYHLGPSEAAGKHRQHGMDFETLTADYFANALVLSVKNGRYLAIGKDANGVIFVVFATLGLEGISVISMRRASRKERRLYEEKI